MKLFSCFYGIILLVLCSFKFNNEGEKARDYLSVPGPVEYNKVKYGLSWSAHPADNYYKQEYLPANENPETYRSMLMIEAVTSQVTLEDAVNAKINELQQRKNSDALTNYQLTKSSNGDEYLLDFIMSEAAGKQTAIVEWNVYRYINLKSKSASRGVMLFGYSKRSYGKQANSFLSMLKKERLGEIKNMGGFTIPMVKISQQ
ncbi:MAG: hypothetical protein ABIS01_00125 [Ferruginibacter sp.]